MPGSTTYRIPGTVSEVSATLVASTTRRPRCGWNTRYCSAADSRAYIGSTSRPPGLAGRARAVFQRVGGVADLPLTAEKDQDVAGPGGAQLVHGGTDGLGLIARFLVGAVRVGDRPVPDLDRVRPPGHLDHRRPAEGLAEALRVDGGGGDDDLEVGPARQQALEVAQDEVDVQAALVRLVNDQRVVTKQPPVALHLGQQDAVGHQLDQRLVAGVVVEPHLIAHGRAELGAQLLGDPRGHGPGGDAARLRVPDLPGDAAAELEADLRQLGGLPGAGLARNDDDLVVTDGRRDLVLFLGDRQLGRIGDHRHGLAARRHQRRGLVQLREDLAERPLPRPRITERGRPVGPAAQPVLIALRQLRQACPHVGERGGHGDLQHSTRERAQQ